MRIKKPTVAKQESATKACSSCKETRSTQRYFYVSYSSFNADGRIDICKICLKKNLDYNNIQTIKDVLLQINRPFIYQLWESALEEWKNTNKDLFGIYMKNLNLADFRELTWKDSDETVRKSNVKNKDIGNINVIDKIENELTKIDDKNKVDVIRMLGYDPFESELEQDKGRLYDKLVDFLDESTLEDGFKLPAVIEIVKTFNQIDKINTALSLISSDVQSVATNAGGIKSLIDTKEKMLKSVLALAKDNGISVNHNNNKSKGAGTLSGIIKQLQEKGFEEAEVNLFDIETCEGMKQVADISNESIYKQLQFDENDYTDMIMQQREMIRELETKNASLEEANRKLRKEILKLQTQGET
ncbi:hypothetical protein [Paenibacillus sp. ISL-20]|uniref:hypothetical protein n=1 Tax=Paenibacillus sp. ISL-20 TaxID=2819163 RepID=UPI001BE8C18B|nr:hypothetical protein [Paenibacillus sp. ISL-20]MBT2759860.1 hypothetical protein [Paenibacillus sp. ISL-20]